MSEDEVRANPQVTITVEDLSAGGETESATDTPSPDGLMAGSIRNMHDVFSNWWRRAILYYLQEYDTPAGVTAMTRQLVEWFPGELAACLPSETDPIDGTCQQLRQTHIPEMVEFDLLRYDRDADTVRIAEDVAVSVAPP